MSKNSAVAQPQDALRYLTRGAALISEKQFRPFILVPILVNVVLFIVLTGALLTYFSDGLDWLMGFVPDWGWLNWLIAPLLWMFWLAFMGIILTIYGYSFNLITNILAAPFYGILAEKIESYMTGNDIDSEPLGQLIPRTLWREVIKLWYFIRWGLVLFVVSFILLWIPLINLLVPVIAFAWGAWSMAVQYGDYPADNHQTPFSQVRQWLGQRRTTSVSFGGLTLLGAMVPLLNIFIAPIAVAGSTLYWLDRDKS